MTMANTLDISPAFTIEDIHKIRERNYEVTKDMTMEELLHYYNTPRTDAEERIESIRRQNAAKNKA
jgi:predicted ATP-binding protein involved in virulence